ncbi:hypothetical protein GIB67_033325 [Kingdonia uniflora]|uniref:RCC1-like domain-containing protein n=1 Tax=Kingdonia uniflora TaxID=39325 RepID=A0A7J7LTG1_9MAGN|nr:hypothetical protein GIB67_033325 [Kingdonia uniflora]
MLMQKLLKKCDFLRCYCSNRIVMSVGDASHGALGLPSSPMQLGGDAYEPTPIPALPSNISTIGAGHYHSLAVTSQGQVWAWGRNYEFQLGRLNPNTSDDNQPMMVHGLNQIQVTSVSASGVVSTAIGEDGSLWVWGKSKRGQLGLGTGLIESPLPSRVQALAGEHVVKVSLGWGHALAYTKDGKLFGWGYAADGRLGHIGLALDSSRRTSFKTTGEPLLDLADKMVLELMEKENEMPIVWEPSLLLELQDAHVVDVACGDDHSLVLCSNGTLLSSGSNTYGQLGRSSADFGMLPVDIRFSPVSISSGLGHCLAVCQIPDTSESSNDIVTWGWNRNSQLGREGPENIPEIVQGLEGQTHVSTSGGRAHSLALTSEGEVFAWGCGKNGRLGLGSSNDEVEPALLDCLQGSKVLQAVSGYDHNLVLVAQ